MSIPLTKREFALAAVITCAVVAAFGGMHWWYLYDVDQTTPRNHERHLRQAAITAGDLIIARLEAYREQEGDYPITLEQLAAWDAQPILPCPAGMETWEYLIWSLEDWFQLRVCLAPSCYPLLYWDSRHGGWRLDQ